MVTINDAGENVYVTSVAAQVGHSWIGLNDATTEGTFVWANGEPVTYTNWGGGEPNNSTVCDPTNGEDYGMIDTWGAWNDFIPVTKLVARRECENSGLAGTRVRVRTP